MRLSRILPLLLLWGRTVSAQPATATPATAPAPARFFRDSIMAPFFARHLHPRQRDVAGWTLPDA